MLIESNVTCRYLPAGEAWNQCTRVILIHRMCWVSLTQAAACPYDRLVTYQPTFSGSGQL